MVARPHYAMPMHQRDAADADCRPRKATVARTRGREWPHAVGQAPGTRPQHFRPADGRPRVSNAAINIVGGGVGTFCLPDDVFGNHGCIGP